MSSIYCFVVIVIIAVAIVIFVDIVIDNVNIVETL